MLYPHRGNGENQEICFWAFSNLHKNDAQEIRIGLKIQSIINKEMRKYTDKSLFQEAGGYENSASVSFMEGESTRYMMKEYGSFRLDFDLRNIEQLGITSFLDCEYIKETDVEAFAQEYATMICSYYDEVCAKRESPERFSKASTFKMGNFLMMDLDLVRKPLIVKEERWRQEREWRKILPIKEGDTDTLYHDKKTYKKVFYPMSALIGITLLFDSENKRISMSNVIKLVWFFTRHRFMWGKKLRIKLIR